MERKEKISSVVIAAFAISFLVFSLVSSFEPWTVDIPTNGWLGDYLVAGLPSANVYVVRNDWAGNYVTINGSNVFQVLETNSNPVLAINNAIMRWVPTNGKMVTNGTMPDWDGTVTPTHGNFTWEAWKTKATQISSYSTSWLAGVNIEYSFVTINNLTYIGRNSTAELGIRSEGVNYITIENCTITRCKGAAGILIGNGVGHSVRFNNVSNNFDATQINFLSVSDSVISHNTVNANGNGQCIGDFGYTGTYHGNVNVTYNTILNWGQNPNRGQAMLRHGFYNSGTAYSYVYNNTFSNAYTSCGGACLIKSAYNRIFNNTFRGQSTDCAFSAYQEPGAGSDWFLSPNGTMFYSNTVTNYAIVGVWLACASTYSTGNITIANNTFVNCGTGIQTNSGLTTHPQNMTFVGNSFNTGTYGIRLGYNSPSEVYTDSIKILNNTMTNLTTGVTIYSGSTNLVVQYNTFSGCNSPVTDTSTGTVFRFNVGLTGYYVLDVTVVGSGSTSPSGLGWQYKSGSTASLTWIPNAGYARQDISVDGIYQHTTVSPINVTMSANHVVVAYFVSAP